MNLVSTEMIIKEAVYFEGAAAFFENFGRAYEATRCQILKLETRQVYKEPGNDSYEAVSKGDWNKSISLLRDARTADAGLYASLKERGVDFIRCRPLKFPLSVYLKWEMEVYKFNAEMCERIFCCNLDSSDFIFEKFARHDFMIFDARQAFIHDYDDDGLIRGGWLIDKVDAIIELQKLFIYIKSHCRPFQLFLP